MEPKDRIIFAADVGSLDELKGYLPAFGGNVGAVKLGMEILTHQLLTGEPIVQYVLKETNLRIMWDLKYGDIPATVAGAAKELAKYGQGRILGFTVHCSAGRKALEDAVKAVKENFGSGPDAPMVIAVTLLTSLDNIDLKELKITGEQKEVVLRWAKIAAEAGVPAIVCSGQETADVLKINSQFVVINPGIRFAGSDLGTQKRVTAPGEAIRNGASYIVMGSDLRKGNPISNAKRAIGEIFTAEYKSLARHQILDVFGQVRAIYDNDHFVYTKGGHGKAYVNKDEIYVDPEALSLLCKEIAYQSSNLGVQVVCGPTVGGVLVANRVAEWLRKFTGDESIIAVFADQEDDNRILKRGYPKKVVGKKALVVEDIINTGGSAAATANAIKATGGKVLACWALCNRATDKGAAENLIGVQTFALLNIDMDNFAANECPYCAENRPVNQELGHGKKFLEELAKINPEKAKQLGLK
jgi:orotidine 5'-phosphate decarboxylase subfamily 1